jgi:hypothetical protein
MSCDFKKNSLPRKKIIQTIKEELRVVVELGFLVYFEQASASKRERSKAIKYGKIAITLK